MDRLLPGVGSRKVYGCPAAPSDNVWDTNFNRTLGGTAQDIAGFALGTYDPLLVTPSSRFSVGYNDWGIDLGLTPQVGLLGDVVSSLPTSVWRARWNNDNQPHESDTSGGWNNSTMSPSLELLDPSF
jgi:hypothetical protein